MEWGKSAQAMLQKGHECMKAGDYIQALTIYHAAVIGSPYSADAHYNIGNAFICSGQEHAPKALTAYENAIGSTNIMQAHILRGRLN